MHVCIHCTHICKYGYAYAHMHSCVFVCIFARAQGFEFRGFVLRDIDLGLAFGSSALGLRD